MEHCDAVLERCDVEVHVPCEVLLIDGVVVQRQLEALVVEVANVVIVAGVAQRRSHCECEEHIGGLAVVEFQ